MQKPKAKIRVESDYAEISNYGKFDRGDFFELFQKALDEVYPDHSTIKSELNIGNGLPSMVRLYVNKPYILMVIEEKQFGFSIEFGKIVQLFQFLITEVSSEKYNLDYLIKMLFDMAKEQGETIAYCAKTNQLTYLKGEKGEV